MKKQHDSVVLDKLQQSLENNASNSINRLFEDSRVSMVPSLKDRSDQKNQKQKLEVQNKYKHRPGTHSK